MLARLRSAVLGAVLLVSATPLRAAPIQGEPVNGFPNWEERVLHEWVNRARCDPQVEMGLCGAPCSEGASLPSAASVSNASAR